MNDHPSTSDRDPENAYKRILETEDYVPVSPDIMADPFYRIAYLIKQEIRKYKWIESENGNSMSWDQACRTWSDRNFDAYKGFLHEILHK